MRGSGRTGKTVFRDRSSPGGTDSSLSRDGLLDRGDELPYQSNMGNEQISRRLSAILAADIVGYSRLMAEDEAGALNALNRPRLTLSDPAHERLILQGLEKAGLLADS